MEQAGSVVVWRKEGTNLHGDLGFHGLTGTVENQREDGEEEEEAENKSREITASREALFALFVLEKAFFFNHGAVLPGLLTLSVASGGVIIGLDLLGSGFERPGESGGGGIARVATEGGVRMGRGTGGAEDRSRLKRRRRLLSIVGVTRRALDVVDWAARRSGWGRWSEACHFWVCFCVHFVKVVGSDFAILPINFRRGWVTV